MQIETSLDLQRILSRYQGRRRDALLPILWEVQFFHGWISRDAVAEISHLLRVPETEIYGVIEFYAFFYAEPTGKRIIRVCTDQACGLHGADEVLHAVENAFADEDVTVEHAPCLGLCDHAPAAMVARIGRSPLTYPNATAEALIEGKPPENYTADVKAYPQVLLSSSSLQLLGNYEDYATLRKVVAEPPMSLIETVIESGLVGRGGAAFPTGLKWKFTRQAEGSPKYVVCNADESEPGTFKDRVLMETHPHLVLEGMALAGYAIGAQKGYVFVRGEYYHAHEILYNAYIDAVQAGLLGKNGIVNFEIEFRRGAGAYICGEETALFEAIEGKRGFPRVKPPYPTTHGLFGKPTVVNNIETLSAVVGIAQHGATWFKQHGTEKSTGTKLFSISGHVKRPAVVEVDPTTTLRELIYTHCGGVDGELQAVLMGGAAGTILTPDEIDVRLTFEDLRAIGGTVGSGAVVVYNDTVDMRDVVVRLSRFFQHESCGKCFPCQLGTQRQLEIAERLHEPVSGDAQRLLDVSMTMTETSLCGLGQTAGSAVMSAVKKFPELFEA